ncbi:uncharacterized protein MELLADRAFT_109215 [Melampsora larici-populina 98AG31]|uniref:Uncharacterized protein n=1 Tax=Melampsora larici-populina (strain 98AG31 / pathotype 3-4-7) TaxID=747676 RepID=F4RVR5_MELLP|nr:uncharacterized protein MELLADRAFT_109215 [Melampsora larici-populina 98AG31]EGG03407.1 hypothetical protein MELLADRAFT_109215 [Melampsora larici-populina 98AG31]
MDIFRYKRLPVMWEGTLTLGKKLTGNDYEYRQRFNAAALNNLHINHTDRLIIVDEHASSELTAEHAYSVNGSLLIKKKTQTTELWIMPQRNNVINKDNEILERQGKVFISALGVVRSCERRGDKDVDEWLIAIVTHWEYDNEVFGYTEFEMEYWIRRTDNLDEDWIVIGSEVTLMGELFSCGVNSAMWQVKAGPNINTMKSKILFCLLLSKSQTRVSSMEQAKSFESGITNEVLQGLPALRLNMHQHKPQDFQGRSLTYYWPCQLEDTPRGVGSEAVISSAWLGEARLFLNEADAVKCITSQLEDKKIIPGTVPDNIVHEKGSSSSQDVEDLAEITHKKSSSSEALYHDGDDTPNSVTTSIRMVRGERFHRPLENRKLEKGPYKNNPSAKAAIAVNQNNAISSRATKFWKPVNSASPITPTEGKLNAQPETAKVNQQEHHESMEEAVETSIQNQGFWIFFRYCLCPAIRGDHPLPGIPRRTAMGQIYPDQSLNHWDTRKQENDPGRDGNPRFIDRKGSISEVQNPKDHPQDSASVSPVWPLFLNEIEARAPEDQLKSDPWENNGSNREYLDISSRQQNDGELNEKVEQPNILSDQIHKKENKNLESELIGIFVEKKRDQETKSELNQRKTFADSLKSNVNDSGHSKKKMKGISAKKTRDEENKGKPNQRKPFSNILKSNWSDPQDFEKTWAGVSGQNMRDQKPTLISVKKQISQNSAIGAQAENTESPMSKDAGIQDEHNNPAGSEESWKIKKGKKWKNKFDSSIEPHSYVPEDKEIETQKSLSPNKEVLYENMTGDKVKEIRDAANIAGENFLQLKGKSTEDHLAPSEGKSELLEGGKKSNREKKSRKKTEKTKSKVSPTGKAKKDDWEDIPILPEIQNDEHLQVTRHSNLEKLLKSIIKPENKEDFMYINLSDETAHAIISEQDPEDSKKIIDDIALYKRKVEGLLGQPEANRRFIAFKVQFSQKVAIKNWKVLKNGCDSDVNQFLKLLRVQNEWPVFYTAESGESTMLLNKLKSFAQEQVDDILSIMSFQEMCQRLAIMEAMSEINSQGYGKVFSERRLQFLRKQGVPVAALLRMEHLLGLKAPLEQNAYVRDRPSNKLLEIYYLMQGHINGKPETEVSMYKTEWIHSPVRKYLVESDEKLKRDFEDRFWCIAEQGRFITAKLSDFQEYGSHLQDDLKETKLSLDRVLLTAHFGITPQRLAEMQTSDCCLTDAIFSGMTIDPRFCTQNEAQIIGHEAEKDQWDKLASFIKSIKKRVPKMLKAFEKLEITQIYHSPDLESQVLKRFFSNFAPENE